MDLKAFYPDKAYPQLYRDVMMMQIFADSKTFADSFPLAPPEEIDELYKKIDRSDKQHIIEFVNHWFQFPETPVENIGESKPIDQHISALWNLLTRNPNNESKLSSLISLPYRYIVPGGRFR